MSTPARPLHSFLLGVALVFAGHVLLYLVTSFIGRDEAIRIVHRGALIAIGLVQLAYAVPIAILVRKNRSALFGVLAAVTATIGINYFGLTR